MGEGNIHAILFLACAILCGYVYQVTKISLVCGMFKSFLKN
jgi:1,4-dihydroxy-2-naphthoate octaprenyltransferase